LPWSRTTGLDGFSGAGQLSNKGNMRSCGLQVSSSVRIRSTQAMTARNCYNTFQQQ
jgi:hypothetical protein